MPFSHDVSGHKIFQIDTETFKPGGDLCLSGGAISIPLIIILLEQERCCVFLNRAAMPFCCNNFSLPRRRHDFSQ